MFWFFFFFNEDHSYLSKNLGVKLFQKTVPFNLHQCPVSWYFFKIISAKNNTQIFHRAHFENVFLFIALYIKPTNALNSMGLICLKVFFFFNVYSQYLPGEIYGNEVKLQLTF